MAEIVLDAVSKIYPDGTAAVSDLSIHFEDGEFIVLVGPSGCGKTTALRMMVASLENIPRGTIRIGERVVKTVPPLLQERSCRWRRTSRVDAERLLESRPHVGVAEFGRRARLRA